MPNWCENIVYMDNILEKDIFSTDEDGNMKLDFMKIKPTPKALDIDSRGLQEFDMRNYLDSLPDKKREKLEEKLRLVLPTISDESHARLTIKHTLSNMVIVPYGERSKKEIKESIKFGKKYVDNCIKYGYPDWYEWQVANWGTKWNACYTQTNINSPDMIMFDTAWSPPIEAMTELSKMYPYDQITHFYYEPWMGYAGQATYLDGECVEMIDVEMMDEKEYEEQEKLFDSQRYLLTTGKPLINAFNYIEEDNNE